MFFSLISQMLTADLMAFFILQMLLVFIFLKSTDDKRSALPVLVGHRSIGIGKGNKIAQ